VLPRRLDEVVRLLTRLPGVGEKTAMRYALRLVGDPTLARDLGQHLQQLPDRVRPCERCCNLAEIADDGRFLCTVCLDTRRDLKVLCVVAKVQDLMAIERSGAHRGRYFVLGRLLSPLDGVGPEELPLGALLRRIEEDEAEEIIVATPPSVDGEATALLVAREVAKLSIRVSRIASGVPHGGDLEFADQVTLGRAIDGRRQFD
jgi:recombination protein RecR